MHKKDEKDTRGFLRELTKLTKKYGIRIGGCLCCGSPYLVGLVSTDGKYVVDEHESGLTFVQEEE